MRQALLVAAGGAIGSVLRWWLGGLVQRAVGTGFPWGTFAVNAVGSLVIGVAGALAIERMRLSPDAALFVVVGLIGGFTTFSAFSFELLTLVRSGQWGAASAYAAGSVIIGVVAAFAGLRAAMKLPL